MTPGALTITRWTLVGTATFVTAFIAFEAATVPFLRGAGLAQADFELFILLLVVGLPACGVVVTVALVAWSQERRKSQDAEKSVSFARWLLHDSLGLVCAANFVVQALSWIFLWYIRVHGLLAVRL